MSGIGATIVVMSLLDRIQSGEEEAVTFSRARELMPRRDGKRPDLAQIYRWATNGVKGHTLESAYLGAVRVTTAEAITRFFRAINGQNQTTPRADVTRKQQLTAVQRRNQQFLGK